MSSTEPPLAAGPYFRNVSSMQRRYLATFRVSRIPHRFTDVLIIGSGAAGLSAALSASQDPDLEVLVLAKKALHESATRWAQGGIAAVIEPDRTGDSTDQHIEDSLAGAPGLADRASVERTIVDGVERVRELIGLGAEFDRNPDGELDMTREGAHTVPRILHRGDTTGQEIARALVGAVSERPNVLCLPDTYAVDLLTSDDASSGGNRVQGVLVWSANGELEAIWARQTILATGGAGRLYRETTNPGVATGDGLAMAFRAGAEIQDLEFVQFHPTTLYIAGADRFLMTEAIRGEGGVLRDGSGNAFMTRFHEMADLAPRDVVSRAILRVMGETGENRVWLDLSAIDKDRICERFPRILEICRGFGIDILSQPIPVRPSAHYTIGGLATDLDARTNVAGLFAAGEVACTMLHGANRLGSNSLLEGLVFGHRAGIGAAAAAKATAMPSPEATREQATVRDRPDSLADYAFNLDDLSTSLKSLMWYRVGVERDGEGLRQALEQIRSWMRYPLGSDFRDPRSWSLQNMLQTSYLMTLCALRREESRGVHYRPDFPERDDDAWLRHLTISREDFREHERIS